MCGVPTACGHSGGRADDWQTFRGIIPWNGGMPMLGEEIPSKVCRFGRWAGVLLANFPGNCSAEWRNSAARPGNWPESLSPTGRGRSGEAGRIMSDRSGRTGKGRPDQSGQTTTGQTAQPARPFAGRGHPPGSVARRSRSPASLGLSPGVNRSPVKTRETKTGPGQRPYSERCPARKPEGRKSPKEETAWLPYRCGRASCPRSAR